MSEAQGEPRAANATPGASVVTDRLTRCQPVRANARTLTCEPVLSDAGVSRIATNAKAGVNREAINAGAWMTRLVLSEAWKAQRNGRGRYTSDARKHSAVAKRRGRSVAGPSNCEAASPLPGFNEHFCTAKAALSCHL